jgi:hypothetical protein
LLLLPYPLTISFQQKNIPSIYFYIGNDQEGSRGYPDGGYDQGYQYGGEQQQQQQGGYVEVTVEPNDATLSAGQTATLTCRVKGAEQFTVTWGKYAHDTNLPNYARVCILNRQDSK